MSAIVAYITDLERRLVEAEFKLAGYVDMTESLMKRVNVLEAAAQLRNVPPKLSSISGPVPNFRLDYWASNLRADA